jgi:hypothetical protein
MMQMLSSRILRWAAVVVLPFLATTAHASFHLFQIDQIYSDASGAVQYIRLSTLFGSQEFLMGQSISSSQGSSLHSFQFPANLPVIPPDTTAGHSFLIATLGFTNVSSVTPDYIVPNNFLFLPGGTITYAIFADTVIYGALPTDGAHAIDRNGVPVLAVPTNFAGTFGSLNVPPPVQAGPMDIDQNGQVDALTDGLMLLRYMFGLRGQALIQGALGQGAARNTAALIETYLATCIAGPGATCVIP